MNSPIASYLKKINYQLPVSITLTNPGDLSQVLEIADKIATMTDSMAEMEGLENQFAEQKNDFSLMIHLGIKLAKSKLAVRQTTDKVHLSVIFAIYKEHNRIKTPEEHPHGEDFLMKKIAQLEWLFEGKKNFSWDMFVVDDGCPEHSGEIAQQILKKHYNGNNVEVHFLQAAIDKMLPISLPLHNTNESRKGGSIEYGMWLAVQKNKPGHIVFYTDADLSIHLGQVGTMIDSIRKENLDAAIGSRREDTSVFIKKGVRNIRGKLFIYLWKRLIPQLNYIVDTQCGFKSFTAQTVKKIILGTIEKQFAFDIELLLKTETFRHLSIGKVAIAGADSVEASTTTDLEPYLDMLKSIVGMYRKYISEDDEADQYATFINALDKEKWDRLVDNIPEAIAEGDPNDFDKFNAVKVSDLEAAIGGE
ncbi:MAG: hypothetical protein DRJ05_06090 [Bacteroidetes bacterium]|nr:MAG: hypothetical protein DRJ05_06090 [Bacteroidota bacterium]